MWVFSRSVCKKTTPNTGFTGALADPKPTYVGGLGLRAGNLLVWVGLAPWGRGPTRSWANCMPRRHAAQVHQAPWAPGAWASTGPAALLPGALKCASSY